MACTSYFSCNNETTRNLGLEQVIKLLVDTDVNGCPVFRVGNSDNLTSSSTLISGKTASITTTANTSVIAAQGNTKKLYITQILVTNGHATVGTYVNIKDGFSTIYTGYASALGGGFALNFPAESPLVLSLNSILNVACETTGSDIRASASGFYK